MKVNPAVVYTGLISFVIGMICGGVLVGSPKEGFAAVIVGVVAVIILYTVYLLRVGGKS